MSKNHKLTAVIPFFNESTQVLQTIEILKNCSSIDKIICVDDGSTNSTSKLISQNYPEITLMQHQKNKGKTAAVKTALSKTISSHVLLFDADLSKLNQSEIENNCKQALKKKASAVIFKQINDPLLLKLLRFDVLFSGERILQKNILKAAIQSSRSEYGIEFAINEYLLDQKIPTYCLPFHSKNKLKLEKWPLLLSLKKTIAFQKQLLKPQYLKHSLFFHPQELKY